MKSLIIASLLTASLAGPALACADGPDSFRVTGVAQNDTLNVRSGPSLGYSVIGTLPHDAEDVQNLDSVPVHTCDGNVDLTPYEMANRWTKVSWENGHILVFGWVKSSFLSE